MDILKRSMFSFNEAYTRTRVVYIIYNSWSLSYVSDAIIRSTKQLRWYIIDRKKGKSFTEKGTALIKPRVMTVWFRNSFVKRVRGWNREPVNNSRKDSPPQKKIGASTKENERKKKYINKYIQENRLNWKNLGNNYDFCFRTASA